MPAWGSAALALDDVSLETMPEPRDWIAQLPLYDRAIHAIGSVAQADVWLEDALRILWARFVASPVALMVIPKGADQLIQDCRALASARLESQRASEAALATLIAAKDAHDGRNWVVHEALLPAAYGDHEPSPPDAFLGVANPRRTLRPTINQRTLADIAAVLAQLERARYRVAVLSFLQRFPEPYPDPDPNPERTESELRLIEGHFDLLPDGSARPHGN